MTPPRSARDSVLIDAVAAELGATLADAVSTATAVREHHSKGESYHPPAPPDIVCFPQTTEQVCAIVRTCARHEMPIVPFGAGTSLEGHVAALDGGVSVDMSRMNRILRVSAADMDVTVEAGVTHRQLNHALRNTGLMFFVDPGADATIGGMTATRASGTTAVRYGTMRENVLALTVVLADGRVLHTGSRARKSASGYDLTRLFVGSEGTLGIVTEVTLRLHGRPEALSAAVCGFSTLEGAVDTVIATIQLGVPVARIELLDEVQMAATARYADLPYAIAPTLFFEFHGLSEGSVVEQAKIVQEIASEHGGSNFKWATTPEDRARLWRARHDAYYAALALRPGAQAWTTDVCVPISRLAECIRETQRDNEAASIPAPLVGHVGDGNFHLIYVIDPSRPAELEEATRLNDRLVARALALGGTCTGEHGVGYGKLPYVRQEHGDALDIMRAIKHALDPNNLMNPGKLIA
ncbi:MAG: FAD-binding protein [Acidobacteria bacterium]|nr:FAD-binding protein [Acidobacteriota bacterium]